ncbi:MAG TPA: membrane dipeptidase [Phycisphaerales bacterium]|nr:membrane dipeptidase [Phycisphaerales bacterium]HMP36816.1 membrane dipeptidase [Phycisphaerales bacterium]
MAGTEHDGPAPWIVDGHLDLATIGLCGRDLLAERAADDSGCVTIPALRRGGVGLVLATIFTERGGSPGDPVAYPEDDDGRAAEIAGRRQLDLYRDLEARGAIRLVRTAAELPSGALRAGDPLPALLLMECADPIRTVDDAAWWFDAGVRIVGLAWARGSRAAGGNAAPGGLSPLGRELVAAFDELGIIHDVSHLSSAGFDELLARATGAVVASHSNCRALMRRADGAEGGERHLSDAQIRALAARDAVIGLNLFGRFLHPSERATIDDCVAHLEHVAAVAGTRRMAALGSDLDGGFGPAELPEGVDDPERLPSLPAALASRGWSAAEVEGFAHRNWLRLLRQALP